MPKTRSTSTKDSLLPPLSPAPKKRTEKKTGASSAAKRRNNKGGVSSGGSVDTESSRESLAINVQKALAQIIENPKVGGRHNIGRGKKFQLSVLLSDADPTGDEFGLPGSRERYRVGKKFDRWKDLPEVKWLKVLSFLEVQDSGAKKKAKRQSKDSTSVGAASIPSEIFTAKKEDSIVDHDEEQDSDEDETMNFPADEKSKTGLDVDDDTKTSAKSKKHTSSTKQVLYLDPLSPGDQGEGVYCVRIWGVAGGGKEYQGVEIEVFCDGRDMAAGLVFLEYIEESNKLFLTKPLMDAGMVEDKVQYDARVLDARIILAHDAHRAQYSKMKPEEKVRVISMELPKGVRLSEKPINTDANVEKHHRGRAKLAVLAYKKNTAHRDTAGNIVYKVHERACWKFVDLSTETNLTVEAPVVEDTAGLVANAFAGLDVRTDEERERDRLARVRQAELAAAAEERQAAEAAAAAVVAAAKGVVPKLRPSDVSQYSEKIAAAAARQALKAGRSSAFKATVDREETKEQRQEKQASVGQDRRTAKQNEARGLVFGPHDEADGGGSMADDTNSL